MIKNVHQKAITDLSKIDKNIKRSIDKFGMPDDRRIDPGFNTLFRMIVGQQISVKAAKSVWGKLASCQVDTPQKLLSSSDKVLKDSGLSRQKIQYIKDLASKILEGSLILENLNSLSYDNAHRMLTNVKGIGDWTADIYQLFVLCDMDAFPQGDIAVQEGARRFFKLEKRPSPKILLNLVEKWRPLRGAGALVMWQIYRIEIHEGNIVNKNN